ncbi:MAG: SDR family NAD(P)-dependent oxidoreductase [Streptosporangiaceae bacterium]
MSQVSQARPHTARWTEADVPPQTGRIAVVTGANTGVGFQVARVLAACGATVVLACRDIAKAETAADRILDGAPRASVTATHLDLASLGSVRAAANALRDAYLRIDLLINNAGVMMTPYGRTADGFERQLGVNHLGPFALTGLLLDRMLAAEGSRVVTVFTYELQRRLAAAGAPAEALAAHPGYARTELSRNLPLALRLGARLVEPIFAQSAAMGALPILRAATDPEAAGGAYFGPASRAGMTGYPVPGRSSARSYDPGLQQRLWAESERLTGVTYPV